MSLSSKTESREGRSDRIVATDGSEYPADVIVLATGFDVVISWHQSRSAGFGGRYRTIIGCDAARAFLGTAIPDFPIVHAVRPNTQFGHGGSCFPS